MDASDASLSVNVARDANSACRKNRLLRAALAAKLRHSCFSVYFSDFTRRPRIQCMMHLPRMREEYSSLRFTASSHFTTRQNL